MRLDAEYYISKTLIPPLERIFNLVGANVRSWYEDMPKVHDREQEELFNIQDLSRRTNANTLHSFMRSRLCPVCRLVETDEGKLRSATSLLTCRTLQKLSRRSRGVDLFAICAISDIGKPPFGAWNDLLRLLRCSIRRRRLLRLSWLSSILFET